MNPRITLLMVVVLAGLALVVYGLNRGGVDSENPVPTPQPAVLTLDPSILKQLAVTSGGKTTTVVKGGDGKWQLAPDNAPADDTRVRSLVSRLATLTATSQVTDANPNLADFGLDQPPIRAELTKDDNSQVVLLVGKNTPVGTGAYAKVEGRQQVFVVATLTVDDLKRFVYNPPTPPH